MHPEVPEALQHEQFSWSGFATDFLVLQAPGGVVEHAPIVSRRGATFSTEGWGRWAIE